MTRAWEAVKDWAPITIVVAFGSIGVLAATLEDNYAKGAYFMALAILIFLMTLTDR